ncbi:MAG: flagellar biosynthesis protein FlaG [Treponema sp.]|nr:MAG: flagellar biosynthesis protein FlaG [Treponema sp.]
MEVTGVSAISKTLSHAGRSRFTGQKSIRLPGQSKQAKLVLNKASVQAEDLDEIHKKISAAMQEIQKLGETFSRKLKFSVNKDINKVVVKVIDATTDKVIREIPAEEVQKLQTRMRETFGLLFDEKA